MKITSMPKSGVNVCVKKWEVFMQTGEYISDGHVIIKSNHVNKIFFPNGTAVPDRLPEKYIISHGLFLEEESSLLSEIASTFQKLTAETLYPVNDLGLTMRQLSPGKNRKQKNIRLLFSLLPKKCVTSVAEPYAKLLDANFRIGITKRQILVLGDNNGPVAIVMPNTFMGVKEELKALQNIFKDFFDN